MTATCVVPAFAGTTWGEAVAQLSYSTVICHQRYKRLILACALTGCRMKSPDLDRVIVETAYARWAPIYDAVCGPVMVKGRRAAAAAARAIGGRILEVGVGTGLSFDDYDATTDITGIDLSAPMLAKAREKMASGRYPYVKDGRLMAPPAMRFARARFDG